MPPPARAPRRGPARRLRTSPSGADRPTGEYDSPRRSCPRGGFEAEEMGGGLEGDAIERLPIHPSGGKHALEADFGHVEWEIRPQRHAIHAHELDQELQWHGSVRDGV